jgi:hypothetical protein
VCRLAWFFTLFVAGLSLLVTAPPGGAVPAAASDAALTGAPHGDPLPDAAPERHPTAAVSGSGFRMLLLDSGSARAPSARGS